MKKYIIPILLFVLFIPLYVNAENCNTDKITINSISVESKSGDAEELNEATANGKSINLNLSMSNVGDIIKYKVVLKNDSNDDYELDKTSLNISSDYIDYSFETDDNSNIVKANSSKTVTLRIEYKNEVPEDIFENGSYNDNKTVTVQLSNNNKIETPDALKNPNTGVQRYILLIFIILLLSGLLYVVLKKKKYTKFMILIIYAIIIIPVSVYALCKCEINIESKVLIESKKKYICKKATSLHKVKCDIYGNGGKGCNKVIGYGNTITYGTFVDGNLKAGDAFDCDVNSDGVYDPESERFYYITSEEEKSILIFYSNINDQENYSYDISGESYHGPVTGYQYLPSTIEWNNEGLISPGTRQIVTSTGSTNTGAANIDVFSYEGKAARLLTYQELKSACGNENMTTEGYLDNCNYLMENINQYVRGNGGSNGYWLETPVYSTTSYEVWKLACYERKLFSFNPIFTDGIRPVIEVLTSNIDY